MTMSVPKTNNAAAVLVAEYALVGLAKNAWLALTAFVACLATVLRWAMAIALCVVAPLVVAFTVVDFHRDMTGQNTTPTATLVAQAWNRSTAPPTTMYAEAPRLVQPVVMAQMPTADTAPEMPTFTNPAPVQVVKVGGLAELPDLVTMPELPGQFLAELILPQELHTPYAAIPRGKPEKRVTEVAKAIRATAQAAYEARFSQAVLASMVIPPQKPVVAPKSATHENSSVVAAVGAPDDYPVYAGNGETEYVPVVQKVSISEKDLRWLAEAIYYEARDQSIAGQIAVAKVIIARAASPRFPNSVEGVVRQNEHRRLRCQFTYRCDGKAERMSEKEARGKAFAIAAAVLGEANQYAQAVAAVKATLAGADHYHADYVKPSWAKKLTRVAQYGDHIFYRS